MHLTSIRIMAFALFTAALAATHPAPPTAPRDEATAARRSAASDGLIRLAQANCRSGGACR
ncbi:hypothetical protein ACVOMS_30155 [Bradyrhizobium guangxiense]